MRVSWVWALATKSGQAPSHLSFDPWQDSCLLCSAVFGRNAAGKDGKERLGGSVLGQIPFLQNCEDEDSDEDDELDSVQHKKQRVKVSPSSVPCTAWPGCDLIEALPRVNLGLQGLRCVLTAGI